MRILKQSHSSKICKRKKSLSFLKIQFVAKYQKIEEGPFECKNNFKTKSHNAKKNRKGGFVGYVKKVQNESGDPFALISADRTWPYGLSSFSKIYCKKSRSIRVRL